MTDETKWKISQKTMLNWKLGVYKNRKRRKKDMKIRMYGEYEVQTDVDCFEKKYGLCEYFIPDSDCRYVIAKEMAKEYEPFDKEKQKEIRTAFNWILDEIDYEPNKNDEDIIKEYYDTQAMKDDLEIIDIIERNGD